MTETSTALAPVAADALSAPLPTFTGAQMAQALVAYRDLQAALDRAMPDQIQVIPSSTGDRDHRKKGYWRAVAIAFNLDVELVSEERDDTAVTVDGEPDWGYLVTYRAATKTGRAMTGDGACYASEKHERQRTVHNIRAHAHTRAKNRAISDLVAFGEVSAEEIERDTDGTAARPAARRTSTPSVISEAQVGRFWRIAREHGWSDEDAHALVAQHGFVSTKDITRNRYDALCKALETTGGAS